MLSVIIPTHNRAHTLERALASVRAQTRAAEEVIVVDDGSTDATPELVARQFPEVRYLAVAHSGVAAARNHGIAAAQGDWLAFLDSDDEWLPTKLETQLGALAAGGERFCHTDEIWVRNGRRVNPRARHRKLGGWIFQACLPLCAISPSAVVIHRSVFETVGGFDESLPACEDYDLWLRVCARYPVLFVDQRLVVKHGGHADQLSRSVPVLDRYRIRALARILDEAELSEADRRAAVAMLHAKIAVVRQGAERRGRGGEVAQLDLIAARYPSSDSPPTEYF